MGNPRIHLESPLNNRRDENQLPTVNQSQFEIKVRGITVPDDHSDGRNYVPFLSPRGGLVVG
jgi:hypothetical protein